MEGTLMSLRDEIVAITERAKSEIGDMPDEVPFWEAIRIRVGAIDEAILLLAERIDAGERSARTE